MCLAIPGKILSIEGDDLNRSGRISFGGVVRAASLAYLPEATIGDYAIVHAGVAIALVDEAEAQQTLDDIAAMNAIDDRCAVDVADPLREVYR
jgi:hydrogenase expression/formation protein HypC